MLSDDFKKVLITLINRIPPSVKWAIDGSASLALQGINVSPHDIDILTDSDGANKIGEIFSDNIVKKVEFSQTEKYESVFGKMQIDGINIDIMGNLRIFRNESWTDIQNPGSVVTISVEIDGFEIKVVSLDSSKKSGYLIEKGYPDGTKEMPP
ncbi:MAG: nucleotidyltransferase domain-containing protein [Thermoplasmataceae archaeon]